MNNISMKTIRTKDPSSACIVDEDCQFAQSLIQAIVGNEKAALSHGVQDVYQVVRANPEALTQVGVPKVVHATCPYATTW